MEAMLVKKQLMPYVDGSKGVPAGPSTSKTVLGFKRGQAEARAEIILSLEPSQLPHARSLDPRVIWIELENVHRSRGFATRLALRRSFLFMTKQPDQSMQSWISQVRGAAHRLEDAEAEASDEDIILVLTQGLPSDYDNFVVSLDATAASNLTLDYVITRLLNEESRQIASATPTPVVKTEPSSALTATARIRRDIRDITCFLCGLKGHYQSHCPRNASSSSSTPAANVALSATESPEFAYSC